MSAADGSSPTTAERTAKLEGLGCKRKRVEDARFTQGKGKYVDDMKLPGMLFGDFVRSPYGHARITKIDKSKALRRQIVERRQRNWSLRHIVEVFACPYCLFHSHLYDEASVRS